MLRLDGFASAEHRVVKLIVNEGGNFLDGFDDLLLWVFGGGSSGLRDGFAQDTVATETLFACAFEGAGAGLGAVGLLVARVLGAHILFETDFATANEAALAFAAVGASTRVGASSVLVARILGASVDGGARRTTALVSGQADALISAGFLASVASSVSVTGLRLARINTGALQTVAFEKLVAGAAELAGASLLASSVGVARLLLSAKINFGELVGAD